jgi:hypothetical protein
VRPKTIVYFERIIFGTLLLSALHAYLSWDQVWHRAQFATDPDLIVAILLWIFLLALLVTLILLVSRRRSKVAMWILIAWVVFGFLYSAVQAIWYGVLLKSEFSLLSIVVLQGIGKGVAVALLFTPSARRWMRREDEKLREVFQ